MKIKTTTGRALAGGCFLAMLFSSAAAFAEDKSTSGTTARVSTAQPMPFTIEGATERSFLMIPFVGNPSMEVLQFPVKNTGAHTASLVLPAFAGVNADEFTASTTCTEVRKGEACLVSVRFRPVTPGAKAATLKIGRSMATVSATSVAGQPLPTYRPDSVLVHFDPHVIDDLKSATRLLTDLC